MRRREFLILVGGAATAWPLTGQAASQGARPEGPDHAVIGILSPFTRTDAEPWHRAFRQGLRGLGWTEGTNLRIEERYADGRADRLEGLAAELVELKVDVIVVTVTPDALAAARATKTIPIVMASAGDPLGTGLAVSLARPGGNVTGLTRISTDLAGKRLELLKEVAPRVSRIAVLWNPQDAISALSWQEIQGPAQRLGLALHSLEARSKDELEAAFTSAIGAKDGAVTALPAPLFVDDRKRITDFAIANKLPSVFHLPEFVQSGGLLSYGPDRVDLFRRAAAYVDKILRGAKPGDLPIEQPNKFVFIVNLRTAKAVGLTIPESVLVRADEVIE